MGELKNASVVVRVSGEDLEIPVKVQMGFDEARKIRMRDPVMIERLKTAIISEIEHKLEFLDIPTRDEERRIKQEFEENPEHFAGLRTLTLDDI